ncbi:DUF3291 domain-containing protein [Hoeflea sp. TYP-13]|uniref:DUF3291 domain-containing protein n=1 Tax=Hoeflea sp. TYP-13 TaxID=3230023 RepID=UPI0034C5D08D
MAIAQMNWGRMKYAPDNPRMAEFMDSLPSVYGKAEAHPGFIWRMPDDEAARQLAALGYDDRFSATVSVWRSVEDLREYTFGPDHGSYYDRRAEWFEEIDEPQLVIWDVEDTARPSFKEAFDRLKLLKADGNSSGSYSWSFI